MTTLKPITRSENELWLIGQTVDQLIGKKLPTTKQVLKLFFHLHKNKGNNVKESVKMTILYILIRDILGGSPKILAQCVVQWDPNN